MEKEMHILDYNISIITI